MLKRVVSFLLITAVLGFTTIPIQVYAEPMWWEAVKMNLISDILGATDGYLQTETIGGALAGSMKGSVYSTLALGISGHLWPDGGAGVKAIGDIHHEGLGRVYKQFQFNSRQLSSEDWRRIDHVILTYLWENKLYSDAVDAYLRDMDPSIEAIKARIKEGSFKTGGLKLSENFYNNLEKGLIILEAETDDPENQVNAFVAFILEAAAIESGDEFNRVNSSMDIDVSYRPQTSQAINNDIVVAKVIAYFSKRGYDYYKAKSDNLANREGTSVAIPERAEAGQPNLTEVEVKPLIRGLEIYINQKSARVGIDRVELDVPPFIENNRTMVPFRFVGESLGAEIGWDAKEMSVTYDLEGSIVKLFIGKNKALVNGIEVRIDENPSIVPRIVAGRTVVPIRFISEALGFDVSWDPNTQSVSIIGNTNPYFQSNELEGEMVPTN